MQTIRRTYLLFSQTRNNVYYWEFAYCRDKKYQRELEADGYVRTKIRVRTELPKNYKVGAAVIRRRCHTEMHRQKLEFE